jgi:cardiolipin synthase
MSDGRSGDLTGAERLATVPNLITLVRLLCLPLYLWLLLVLDERVAAAVLLALLGTTDWMDGFVARRYRQASTTGKVLDPVVDRLLFFVGIGGIIAVDGAPLWIAVAVLVRESLVSVATVVLALLGARRIDVTRFGKAATLALMFAFPLFLGGTTDLAVAPVLWALGWIAAIPGLALSYYAAALYIPLARAALRDRDRNGQAAQAG